jgi:hypothetical protein
MQKVKTYSGTTTLAVLGYGGASGCRGLRVDDGGRGLRGDDSGRGSCRYGGLGTVVAGEASDD